MGRVVQATLAEKLYQALFKVALIHCESSSPG
jgi:hypothetical protein